MSRLGGDTGGSTELGTSRGLVEQGGLPLPSPHRDSSDEETVGLWLGALRTLRGHEQEQCREQGRLLRQRIQEVAGGRGGARRLPPEMLAQLRAQLKEEASEESDGDSYGVPGEDSSFSR